MYCCTKINNDIIWIGVNDRKTERFENYIPLDNGVTYNSYLILDEKICIIDGVEEGENGNFLGKIVKDLLEYAYIEEDKKNIDNRYTLPIYIDDERLEKMGLENYQDYLINWISIAYLRMLTKIHDFLINYYNLTLEKVLKIDDVMLVLIDILDTEVKDFPKGLKKSIEVGKETAGKCFFINKVIQPVPLTPELTLLLQGKDAYNVVPRI